MFEVVFWIALVFFEGQPASGLFTSEAACQAAVEEVRPQADSVSDCIRVTFRLQERR